LGVNKTHSQYTSATGRRLASAATAKQAVQVAGAFLVYLAVRALTNESEAAAYANAEAILRIESGIGIAWERTLQAATLSRPALLGVFNWIYAWTYWPLLFGSLILTWLVDRQLFYRFRNTLIVSGTVGLLIFMFVPVAPPRFLDGFVDTVSSSHRSNFIAYPSFVINKFAALPSFHVGWSAMACFVLAKLSKRRIHHAALAVPPVLMSVAVVVTANHYIVDVVAGLALSFGSYWVARRWVRPAESDTAAEGDPCGNGGGEPPDPLEAQLAACSRPSGVTQT